MKNIFKALVVLSISFFSMQVFATEKASLDTDFNAALTRLVRHSYNLNQTVIQGRTAYRFWFTTETDDEFDNFGTTDEDQYGFISVAPQAELNAGFGYQCVGFVKSATDLGSTSTWVEGDSVTSFNLPERGDVIATFDSNGDYDFGHVAIVLGTNANYVYVIDQNWEGTGANPVGRVIIHAIPFNGTGLGDADSYSIVEH